MACARFKEKRNRRVIDFYDQHGKRRWKTLPEGTTRTQAKKVLRGIEDKVEKGDFTAQKDIPSLSEAADKWLELKRQKRRESTCDSYRSHMEKHLKPYYGKTSVARIKVDSVERFIKHLQKSETTVPTIKKILRTFQDIMTYACRKKWIYSNPVKEAERPEDRHEYKADKEDLNILNPEQIRKLIDAVEGLKFKTLLVVAVSTGMRQGEILGPIWDDFDWIANQIHVKRTFNHGQFYTPKSKYSKRKIDMAPQLVKHLKEWKLACPKTELDLVFPNEMGNPINANNLLNRVFKPALKKAKLPEIRFHDLRHTYASILIEQGENPKYIQVQMGHSSIQVTYDIYGHLMKTENPESAIKLGNTIFGENWESGSKMVAETKKGVSQID